MESKNEEQPFTFRRLQRALIAAVNSRILNGDYTERGLARILGVSQPQIHNVLKGARKLKPELADRILLKLNINLLELISNDNSYIRFRNQSWTYPEFEQMRKAASSRPVGRHAVSSVPGTDKAS